ncbi:hypothetical protein [Phycicoccus sp.]|uniref:hypothetical protein n=1 Tax=Phycicoccus sp. TaxID=1902410 RepID=UPI002BF3E527|nr:hypothetical protein [Phycicoccus sp.]HMM93975.1 hypothetical protein [Phycicoccus sp.]
MSDDDRDFVRRLFPQPQGEEPPDPELSDEPDDMRTFVRGLFRSDDPAPRLPQRSTNTEGETS